MVKPTLSVLLVKYFGGDPFSEQRDLILGMRDALVDYGRHTTNCDLSWKGSKHNPQCTCGWEQLKKAL